MSEGNRFAAPLSDLNVPTAINQERLLAAHIALNRARMSFVVGIGGYFGLGFLRIEWAPTALIGLLVALIWAHVFLGLAAARSGRSWLVYGLIPVLVPVIGGLIAFGILRSQVPYADTLSP